ncbi:MAG: GNAT family N-acetyltransferase [Bacillus sp. (in: Bacteria)]|nr:GNAT family N-acetyltransferase [Bacillus sp. (in: firmicutes)]MCM1427294.1 GNAT family N-acetyltransferase [Eubacterium sp.]
MEIQFRQGTIDNLDVVTALANAAIAQMESQGIMQWDEFYPTREDFRADIEAGNLYIGYDKDEAAVIYVLSQEFDEDYRNGNWQDETKSFYVLHRLCVNPKYQHQGIAGLTMEHMEKKLKAQGIEAVRLDVFTQNPYALKLYDKCGYQNVGMAHWRKGDFYLMEKYL